MNTAARSFELFVLAWVILIWIVVLGCVICKILAVCCNICGELCNGAAVRRRVVSILIGNSPSATVVATSDDVDGELHRPGNTPSTVASMVLGAPPHDAYSPALLPIFEYSSRTQRRKMDCTVCLEELREGDKGRFLPACMHSFHAECIDTWLTTHPTCPICRTFVYSAASDLDV